MNIASLLKQTTAVLSFSDTPQLDAQVLAARILNKSRAWLLAHLDADVTETQKAEIEIAVKKLGTGEPFPYVLGKWGFFGLEFDVSKDVLIPRPETELLVEKAIAHLQTADKESARPEHRRRVADIGTGSGAIAVSIAKNIPAAQILATDISPAALEVAQRNAQKHNVSAQIQFIQCDLLPNSEFRIQNSELDLLCANLPYIPTQTLRGLSIYNREPTLALDGGLDGLDLFRRLFKLAPLFLAPRAVMLLEIESTLGAQTIQLASSFFSRAEIHLYQDLSGKDRIIEICT